MNKQLSHLFRHRERRKKGDTTQLAAQLAPLEEQKKPEHRQGGIQRGATQEYGAIVVGNENVSLHDDIMEGRAAKGFLGMEPVVLVILVFMLAFIAFIAWQIWRTPPELVERLLSP
jgi:hypothetical protein